MEEVYGKELILDLGMCDVSTFNRESIGNTFYCPCGHGLCITQKSVASKLQSAERSVAYQEKTVARLIKSTECLRGVQTRHRNRLLRGHCPYCDISHLQDLVKHIKRHHNPERA